MKKIIAIIAVFVMAAVAVLAGCQKQEAAKPVEQSAVTTTAPAAPATAPTATTPAAAPAHK